MQFGDDHAGGMAQIIAQRLENKADESFGLPGVEGAETLLELQTEPLLGDPTFDTIVRTNRVDPAGWLEVSVEDTEGDAGPHDWTWLRSFRVQRERNHLSRNGRIADGCDFLAFAKHGRRHDGGGRGGLGRCRHGRGRSGRRS